MPVPDFQEFMLPVLRFHADGAVKSLGETAEDVARQLALSEADRNELAGKQVRYRNRNYWAISYLTQAGLLEYVGRGQRRITSRGADVLARKVARVDRNLLREFEEFRAFESRSKPGLLQSREGVDASDNTEIDAETPEERLHGVFASVQAPKRAELMHAILKQSPTFFERLVLDVLTAAGYGGAVDDPASHLGSTGDGGVDGAIKEDALGLELIYVQAKRYAQDQIVGRPSIQQFAGSLEGFRAKKGVFITTSSFSSEAREYARKIEKRIALIDGDSLLDLMIKHGVGCRTVRTFDLKAIDQDYFEE